jgi:glycosyltransferase involved in cell wall biosynthesis
LTPIDRSKISVISFSLNSGRFLRETIESVLKQTYKNYEHILIDGGSTDNTIDILKEYPHMRWISEKEESDDSSINILNAIWRAFAMSRGEYIIYLSISDGILDENWFKRGVEVLDTDNEVSSVWGLSQSKSEDGHLGRVFWVEYLENHPPQKMDFFPFWLSNGHGIESNAIFRRDVFEICFPKNRPDEPYKYFATVGFNYKLNTLGYLPYFLPIIAFYGCVHEDQLQQGQRHYDLLDSLQKKYIRDIKSYKKNFLSGKVRHCFRNGSSEVLKEVSPSELGYYRRKIWKHRIRHKLRRNIQKLLDHI